jgi:hypothetical protein
MCPPVDTSRHTMPSEALYNVSTIYLKININLYLLHVLKSFWKYPKKDILACLAYAADAEKRLMKVE